jgi:SAM-dependent methyltransferase
MARLVIEPAGGDTATPLNLSKRLAYIAAHIERVAGSRFVDCGCGGGEYVASLIESAKLRAAASGRAGARLARGDIQHLPLPTSVFDLALVNEVLEHVPDDLEGLREVHRVLRPGGHVVVFSPNRLYPFETHGVFLKRSERRLSHATPFVPWVPLALGRHVFRYWARNYWPWELRRLVRKAGFEIVSTGYVWQTFENISGHQPGWMRRLSRVLRGLSGALERVPGVRAFGVSQALVARRPARS